MPIPAANARRTRHRLHAADEVAVRLRVEQILLDVRRVERAEQQAARAHVVGDGDESVFAAEVADDRENAVLQDELADTGIRLVGGEEGGGGAAGIEGAEVLGEGRVFSRAVAAALADAVARFEPW